MEDFPSGIDFVLIDLLEKIALKKGTKVPPGGGEDEALAVSSYMGGTDIGDLAVWLSITKGPVLLSQPLIGFALPDNGQSLFHYRDVLEAYPEWRRRNWMPIACDGCGNYYLYPLSDMYGAYKPVFFVDVAESTTKPSYAVASHLFYFLVRLVECELFDEQSPFEKEKVLKSDLRIQSVKGLRLPWEV